MTKQYDLIIIGAGPAGISAAIYAARAKLRTLMIDSGESGGQIRITSEVVNYPGILQISGAELSDTMRRQAKNFGAEQLHARIDKLSLEGDWKEIETDRGTFRALGVIVATGSRPRPAGFAGEEAFRGRGIGYCATCDGEFFTGLDVFVVGGGFAAAEEAIFLTRYARKVTVLVRGEAFTCSESIADKVKSHPKIEVRFRHEILEVSGEGVLGQAVIRDNATGEETTYRPPQGETFGVFVFAGYEPMSDFVSDQLELDPNGYILTDEDMQTNLPGVYAAGDVRPKRLRQLVTAAADGALASTNAERYIKETRERLELEDDEAEKAPRQTDGAGESLLDENLKEQLAGVFGRFERDVYLAVTPGVDAEHAAMEREMRELVSQLEPLSDKLHQLDAAELPDARGELPRIVLYNHEREPAGISYQAVPGGHEFNSFVLALYNLAGPGQAVDEAVLQSIREIETPVRVQVGVTLSCTMCPDVVQGCQLIAAHNPKVSVEIIDISRDAAFRGAHQIMSVPAMVLDGERVFFGKKSLEQIVPLLRGAQG